MYPSGPTLNQNFGVSIHNTGPSIWSVDVGGNQSSYIGILNAPAQLMELGTEASPGAHGKANETNVSYWDFSGRQHSGWRSNAA